MNYETEQILRKLVSALKFYGPEGDFDLAEYQSDIGEDGGDKARAALKAFKRFSRTNEMDAPDDEEASNEEET